MEGYGVNKRRSKQQNKIMQKTWIKLLIRAVEEDLAKEIQKCANTCCERVTPERPRAYGWRKRNIRGAKKWLCGVCTRAYDHSQYCEFCSQIYLDEAAEVAALDGEEWAQCEVAEQCNRWAHVKCLAKACRKNRSEIVSKNFKYICCDCNSGVYGKRRRSNYSL
jgi:hypothetical protein